MARRNRRLLASLIAWAEILDALGWNVALNLPGRAPFLSPRVQQWAAKDFGATGSWQTITDRIQALPAVKHLGCTAQVQVWVDLAAENLNRAQPEPQVPFDPFGADKVVLSQFAVPEPSTAMLLSIAEGCCCSGVERIRCFRLQRVGSAQNKDAIDAAEAEGVVHHVTTRVGTTGIWHHVEIAGRSGV